VSYSRIPTIHDLLPSSWVLRDEPDEARDPAGAGVRDGGDVDDDCQVADLGARPDASYDAASASSPDPIKDAAVLGPIEAEPFGWPRRRGRP
jgi:hypothetical protein